jgi:hypothetical protein
MMKSPETGFDYSLQQRRLFHDRKIRMWIYTDRETVSLTVRRWIEVPTAV